MRSSTIDAKGGGRIIRGSVSSAGAITSGVGFTVTRTGLGIFIVNFGIPFVNAPDVVVSCNNPGLFGMTFLSGKSTNQFEVDTYSSGFALADRAFEFVAIEQER